MWRPPKVRRHPLPVVQWPTEEQAASARWFSPITAGPLQLQQRTWVPAMVPWRATEEGFVTDAVLDWYERFAMGKPGAIVVEATGIRDVPSGPLLRIGDDRFIPGLKKLTARVREASGGQTRLLIQLIDFLSIRRRPPPEKYFNRYLKLRKEHWEDVGLAGAPEHEVRQRLAALPRAELVKVLDERELEALDYGYRERVTDDLPHIRDLPEALPPLFSAAAKRAEEAGFDGIELHFAHAYTMASFLSAKNTRSDGYGSTREGRVRLPIEVVRAVRAAVSPTFGLGCRFLTEEVIEGGSTVADAEYFGIELARAGLHFLSLSRGGKFEDAKQPKEGWAAYPYTGQSGYECMPTVHSDERGPYGRNLEATARVRAAVRAAGFSTPIVGCGGIVSFEQAEAALEQEQADIIASARQSLADPDWFAKVRAGRGADVRRCELTNYCEGLDQMHKAVTCKLWDRLALDEPNVRLTADGRRRLTAPR